MKNKNKKKKVIFADISKLDEVGLTIAYNEAIRNLRDDIYVSARQAMRRRHSRKQSPIRRVGNGR